MKENDLNWAACIVYYEDSESLTNLINQLASQTLRPTEIFVVDNYSNTVPSFLNKTITVNHIKLGKNYGFATAANVGINAAMKKNFSKFILFSQDVELENDSCKKLIETLNFKSGITFPTMINRKNNSIFSKGGVINIFTGSIKLFTKNVPNNIYWADGSCLAFDKKTFTTLNGFYEKYFMYFEDVDFCMRAKLNNFSISHVDTQTSQNPNGPSPFLRSKNSILLSRHINSNTMKLAVTKRNILGAILLFAKFRFSESKQRFKGIIEGWKVRLD